MKKHLSVSSISILIICSTTYASESKKPLVSDNITSTSIQLESLTDLQQDSNRQATCCKSSTQWCKRNKCKLCCGGFLCCLFAASITGGIFFAKSISKNNVHQLPVPKPTPPPSPEPITMPIANDPITCYDHSPIDPIYQNQKESTLCYRGNRKIIDQR